MKNIILNYTSLTDTKDKILYIIVMSIVSVICAVCFVISYFYILDCIKVLVENASLVYAISIFSVVCCMYLMAIICGASILKIGINALCIASFLVIYFLCFSFLDSILNFQFGWFLVWFGFFMMILPNLLLLLDKIPITMFLLFFLIVNVLTFGINFLTYGSWGK